MRNEFSVDMDASFYKDYLFKTGSKCGFNTCFVLDNEWKAGITSLFQKLRRFLVLELTYSKERLDKACERALFYEKVSIKIIKYILKHKLDYLLLDSATDIFGQYYFQFEKEKGQKRF